MKPVRGTTGARWNYKRLFVLSFLCGFVLMNLMPVPCCGSAVGDSEPVFSVTSTGEPLYEVLAKISKATGYLIEITKGWEKIPIMTKLENVTLEEGIKEIIRLMGRPNYAMTIHDGKKKVEIKIYDAASGHTPAAGRSLVEFSPKPAGAALAPAGSSAGQDRGTGADAGAETGSPDTKEVKPLIDREKEIAERASMERRMEEERALRERKMEAERAVMEQETRRKLEELPGIEIISPN